MYDTIYAGCYKNLGPNRMMPLFVTIGGTYNVLHFILNSICHYTVSIF